MATKPKDDVTRTGWCASLDYGEAPPRETSPTPQSVAPPAVRCSAWVEELEAARNHVANALDKCPLDERRMSYVNALKAATLLMNAVNAERSRSSTATEMSYSETATGSNGKET